LLVTLWLLPSVPLVATLTVFIVLSCVTTFGQAALFPSSMAVAVRYARSSHVDHIKGIVTKA
jgi:hypothetical protein